MKILNVKQTVDVPDGVEASVKARVVTIKGPRGSLSRSFRHLAVDIFMPDAKSITVRKKFNQDLRTERKFIANLGYCFLALHFMSVIHNYR